MDILDSFSRIEKYDESNMVELIESFPDQCQDSKRIGDKFNLPEGFKRPFIKDIVCTGVGGSAIGADLVRSYTANDARLPLFVNRNYTLPNFVGKDTLVIVSSYSGDTEETLSAYQDARSRGSRIIAITSGGRLERKAGEDGVPCINIPAGFPPRSALGHSFFPLLILLSKIGIIKNQAAAIDDAIRNLRKLKSKKLGRKIACRSNLAKRIAERIYGTFPVIYAGLDHMDSVVTRWRSQLAENAKTLASSHLFPEMNHNEIVGWEHPANILKRCAVIMLRDISDNPRISKRMDATKAILKKNNTKVIEAHSIGKGLLARIFSLVYIGDFVSFYLAILNKVDPTPVEKITYLKKELAKG